MTERLALVLLVCSCFSEPDVEADPSTTSTTSTASSSASDPSPSTSTTGHVADSTESTSSSTEIAVDSSTSDADSSSSSSSGEPPIEDFGLYFDGDASMQSTEAVELAIEGFFTVEAWVRFDSPDSHGQIVTHRGAGTTGWELFITSDTTQIAFGVFDNNGEWHEAVGDNVSDYGADWHHVAGTKSGTSLLVHVDGALVATQSCPMGMGAPTVPVRVGTGASPLDLSGVDDVRISDVARYIAGFDPPSEFLLDANTLVLVILDEGVGRSADELAMGLLFDLTDALWIAGNTE